MIKIYENKERGRVKVFFAVGAESQIVSVSVGNNVVPNRKGFQFYVDYWVAEQIDKTELVLTDSYPRLRVKDGESVEIPTEEQEKQREIEELERKLKELRGEETPEEE